MNGYIQYPDITEILHIYHYNGLAFEDKEVKTEFLFWLQAPGGGESEAEAAFASRKLGLTKVASMNNWWPSHCGQERRLNLWWRHFPNKPNTEHDHKLTRWCFGEGEYNPKFMDEPNNKSTQIICQSLAGSGCGFKLINDKFLKDANYKCDMRGRSFYRFFTLIRMPLKLNGMQKQFMEEYHYRLLDTGKLATYWVNGWKPEEYSMEKEYKFFNTNHAQWQQKGDDNY